MEAIVDKLRERLREEEKDIEVYENLMHEARKKGMLHLADALYLIMKDEESHRDYLEIYLREWDH